MTLIEFLLLTASGVRLKPALHRYRSLNSAVALCRIAAPSGHRIRLDFRGEFHIETSEDCDYDYLQVVDGPFSYSPLIGRYCGRLQPPLIESTGRYLWLRFHSDDSIEYIGFHIVYEFIPAVSDRHHDDSGKVINTFADI